ncbi:MAG: 2-vinyl bacteriochlorophyllide hydratase, partial [Pseudomonadota bacterium]
MYNAEQLARRDASPLTRMMMIGATVQLLFIFISFYFVIRFLVNGEGNTGVQITFWLNVALLWFNTVVGMLWEKDMYGHYFMCREFFKEDVGNLAALIAYNIYFIALWLKWSQNEIAVLMLFANSVYLVNFAQWILQYMK